MNRFPEQFKNSANAALSADERARMRARLERALSERPALIRSPYGPWLRIMSTRYAYAFAAFLLILGVSGSTAYAAQDALPGDTLYAVKVDVNEPVALALAATPQSKAETHASIAATRLSEAQELAASGSLTATTSAQLADSFEANATAATAIADSVATTEPALASTIRANLSNQVASQASALLDAGDAKGDGVRVAAGIFVRRALATAIAGDRNADARDATTEIAIAEQPVNAQAKTEAPASVTADASVQAVPVRTMMKVAIAPTLQSTTTDPEAQPEQPRAGLRASALAVSLSANAPFDGSALGAALDRAQSAFDAASSTLDASTTARVGAMLGDVKLLSVSVHSDLSAGDEAAAHLDAARAFAELARIHTVFRFE